MSSQHILPTSGIKRKRPDDPSQSSQSNISEMNINAGLVNWGGIRAKIINSMNANSIRSALSIIVELRDNIELVHSTEYPSMLASLMPVFRSILKTVPCSPPDHALDAPRGPPLKDFEPHSIIEQPLGSHLNAEGVEGAVEHRIRYAILELCTRLPQNEVLRPYSGTLSAMAMEVLHSDYEDNALLAARIVFELHKSYRPLLVDHVQQFLDFVQMSYRTLPTSVQRNFLHLPEIKGEGASSINMNFLALRSTASFRVLTECPLTVMLLFQLYPKYIKTNLLQLLPLMMDALAQRPPSHATALLSATKSLPVEEEKDKDSESKKNTAMMKSLYYRRARELLSAQVKTLSFVTHLLRGYGEHMKPYEENLATNVLNLFQMCPREALATRKDLLLALRHIFATSFRKGFFKHIDTLLDERILIGKHRQSEHTHLKGAAYGALADLFLHVRSRLSMAQVSRIVHIYSRVLHDASMSLPLVVQTTSARLLLNMVDPVYHNKEEKSSLGRDILFRILETLVWKVGMLVDHGITDVQKTEEISICASNKVDVDWAARSKTDDQDIYGSSFLESQGTIQNVRELMKPLLSGIKTLIWCINNYGNQRGKILIGKDKNEKTSESKAASTSDKSESSRQSDWYEELAVQSLNVSERALIEKYFVWTLQALKVFKEKNLIEDEIKCESGGKKGAKDQYRDVLESFATSIAVLDSFNFQRIVGPKMQLLIDCIIEDDDVIIVPQSFLLQNSNVTSDFTSCLLRILMQKSNELDLGIDDSNDQVTHRMSEVKMKLFGLIFSSLSTYPKNEQILRPHLQCIIAICLRRAMGSDVVYWPGNHLTVLRKLFRAIAGGKFEESYKEILPLLPTLLNGLYRLYCHTEHEVFRKVVIELCLTIPARLSSLLPHLSLLLRVIIPALQTGDGDLVNLGLRTLEFWVDNLNSEFLFPIISRDENLFSELMATLSTHLQPAPYQYGLLTLRLLGKLGGKNRLFLRCPMSISSEKKEETTWPRVQCEWNMINNSDQDKGSSDKRTFSLPIPLERAMKILEKIAKERCAIDEKHKLRTTRLDLLATERVKTNDEDLLYFKEGLFGKSTREQAEAAFIIIRSAIALLLEIEVDPDSIKVIEKTNFLPPEGIAAEERHNEPNFCENDLYVNFLKAFGEGDISLKRIFKGLLFALNIEDLEDEANVLLDGLMEHMILTVASRGNVRRDEMSEQRTVPKSMDINTGVNYFILNEVFPKVLHSREKKVVKSVLLKIQRFLEFIKSIEKSHSNKGAHIDKPETLLEVWTENLLYNLCQDCLEGGWESRLGVYKGICLILNAMDQEWCRRFEVELVHVAVFCLKDNPNEATLAQKEALVFYMRTLAFLYSDRSTSVDPFLIIHDLHGVEESNKTPTPHANKPPNMDAIPSILLAEAVCTKSIVRFATFTGLEYIYEKQDHASQNSLREMLSKHSSIIKRHIFSKSLRHLPLQDQVATIETFSFVMKHSPGIIPLSDNHVLIFLSELLKMMSVADGEMASESISNSIIINKDGYSPKVTRSSCMVSRFSSLSHATGLFLRESFDVVYGKEGYRMKVPAELPIGIQYRVSSLRLFHAVLRVHGVAFLEAETSSSIGNILPHIVSLLFRSLTSRPQVAMEAAYDALRDILLVASKGGNGDSQGTPRLPKNLLQMCIRPVLLNLRDYTKLSIPLLRGLSRLLSLLSSWFSKTLGEKLLEHLQRWADPDNIMNLRVWKAGEEPLVAAEIIALFQLLPDEKSLFVEPLIKTTLKLESVLPRYTAHFPDSPFRVPLAKYLNKHGRSVALFFINEHRLKNPIYSELLQDVLKREDSVDLRATLSSKDCSKMLLSVCFERPLAIIRSEKGKNPSSRQPSTNPPRPDNLKMHGVNIGGDKLASLQKDLKVKEEKMKIAKRDEARAKDNLQKKTNDQTASAKPADKQKSINAAQQKYTKAHALVESLQKAISLVRSEHAKELKKSNQAQNSGDTSKPKPMCLDALELQFQGFCVVDTLASCSDDYIKKHNDIVQAFRWLWRSKGRHFRLLHEDVMPPRYNGESRFLAKFLVSYSNSAPEDIDVLFDLIRIFLQPTSADFSFVRDYLKQAVCNEKLPLAQKRRIMSRFASVVTSEGIEELKAQTIQLLAIPMLNHDFKRKQTHFDDPSSGNKIDDIKMDGENNQNDSEASSVPNPDLLGDSDRILNKDLANLFLAEILIQDGKSRIYCSRLSVELLKICSLLLDFIGKELGQHQQTVLKFAWSVLKNEDSKAKHWAYITICKFISMFDTPPKIVLQVFTALLRSYQQETRELVRTALDVLIPALATKLTPDDYSKAMNSVIKILYEEGNSVPQLSHLWQIIVQHEPVFHQYRRRIAPHLVSSLNKLGLPLNSSTENRELSLSLVHLAIHWDQMQSKDISGEGLIRAQVPIRDKNKTDHFVSLSSPGPSPSKKNKIDMEKSGLVAVHKVHREGDSSSTLDQSEIDTVINFLVKMMLSVTVTEKTPQYLSGKVTALFQKAITCWPKFVARIESFDKAISICFDECQRDREGISMQMSEIKSPKCDEKIEKKSTTAIASKQSATTSSPVEGGSKKGDEQTAVPNNLLSSCLEIFVHLKQVCPQNDFLRVNVDKLFHLIQPCFKRAGDRNSEMLRKTLKHFLVLVFADDADEKLQGLCRYSLEQLLMTALEVDNDLPGVEKLESRMKGKRFDIILYVFQIVDDIVRVNSLFLRTFTGALIYVTEKVTQHLTSATSKSRNTAKSCSSSASPVETIFEAACNYSKKTYSMKTSKSLSTSSGNLAKPLEQKDDVECLVYCLHFLGSSSVPFHFTENRKKYFAVLNDILESSTDVRILMSVVEQVGRWVSEHHGHTPLTKKEIKFFLTKMISLESRGLSDIESQPLRHMISAVVLKFTSTLKPSDFRENDDHNPRGSPQIGDETFKCIFNRAVSSSLMDVNTRMRNSFCKIFASTQYKPFGGAYVFQTLIEGKEFDYLSQNSAIKGITPAVMLQKLFQGDFEGLAFRMWTFVFVDTLLGICSHEGGVKRGEDGDMFNVASPIFLPTDSENSQIHVENSYRDFLRVLRDDTNSKSTGQTRYLTALRILASCDGTLCQDILVVLMQEAWKTISCNKERRSMVPLIEMLLNRPYHTQFLKHNYVPQSELRRTGANAVKSFLQVVCSLAPLPMISIDLLVSLAANYNCWHEVRIMLEKQHTDLDRLPGGAADEYQIAIASAIRRCYLEIGEKDTWMALKSDALSFPGLKKACNLDMYGKVCEALSSYENLIKQVESANENLNYRVPSDEEMSFLEDRWIALHKETCQWAVLAELADESGYSKLMMECAWKNRDWEKLRSLSSSPVAVSSLELGDIDVKMNEIFLAISDGKLNEIENLHAQTAQLCLYKWQLLPPIFSGCNAHLSLLHNFNRLVDIRESGQIMVETRSYSSSGKSYPDFKNLLTAWRNRLPNDSEPISVWDDIFQWRSHMFSAITNKFQWAEQGTLASLHDRPWTAIRLARTARQQGIPQVSLMSLGKLTDCAMDVTDAFSKLTEQILSYRKGSEVERKGGLNLINTTNLSYFDSSQKSELFRLKADFLESLGGRTKATQAYCHAVQLCPTYSKAWRSWGGLCWSLADLVERQGRTQLAGETPEDKEKKASNAKKVCQYLAQSMGCYLEAIHWETSEDSRLHLPRCLIMLTKDGSIPGLLCSTFEKYALVLPIWVWLPWIPQLLSSLCRTEAQVVKSLLHGILAAYPQAAYFSLRSFYLERRDHERSRSSSGGGGGSSVSYAEELMSGLRKSQPTLWTSLESILEELIIRFRPSYEEELLATITALLQRADTQLEHQAISKDVKESDEEAVRSSFTKTLVRVSAKFFHSSPDQLSSKDERAKRTAEFTKRYKESFERDFSMVANEKEKAESNLSLNEIIFKLKKWKNILESRVSSTPPCLPLMQVSPSLSAFSNATPDLWAGSCDSPGTSMSPRSRGYGALEKDSTQSPSSSATAALTAAISAAKAVAMANSHEGGGIGHGSGWVSVEIPGQYPPNVGSDGKPAPELHAKLIKFESTIEVSRRNDQLVRRIGMIGSDGNIHQFLLQFAIPYWTRTDERTTQLHHLLGKCLRKEAISSRRNLWLRPTAVIPIAQRLRMTAEEKCHVSLDDVYSLDCKAKGKDYMEFFNYFQETMKPPVESESVGTSLTQNEGEASIHSVMNIKVRAFRQIQQKASSQILTEYIENLLRTSEKYFQFQRTFASQTALNSLLQYIFSVNERVPSKFIFDQRNAHVISPDFRFSYTNQGFMDEKKLPFRLTCNIETFIGPFLMKGIFVPAMTSAATAICANEEDNEQSLQLLFRDDIVSWYLSKSSQRDGSQRTMQELERQLSDRVKKNVYLVQSRLRECVASEGNVPVDAGVHKLISIATSPENLAAMPLNFAPWL